MAPVYLYVYDLSRGLAKTMSLGLVGKQIDGIWHTAVVTYGKEFAFGQGIQEFIPGVTPYGHPVEKIFMGNTEIPEETYMEYIQILKETWTASKYHLLDNNCNSFSDEVCQFLVGKGIPPHITGLPAEFLNSPFGQMVRPQIEAMFGASGHSTLLPAVANLEDSLIKCTNISVLREIIDSNRFVIILFGEKNCTPSKQITPEFESLIRGRSKLPEKLVGVYVETSIARDICQSYNVSATPTFLLYLDGQRYLEFFGGDTSKLKISVENLLDASAPMNKHHNNNFNRLIGMINSEPKSFTSSLNHEIALEKLNSALGSANLVPLLGNYKEASLPPKTGQKLVELLKLADRDKILPLLELARELTLNPRIRTEIIQNRGDLDEFLNQFIHQFRSSDREVLVELMHFICNLFPTKYHSKCISELLSTESCNFGAKRNLITTILTENLLSADKKLRQTASALAYNIAWAASQVTRLSKQTPYHFDEGLILEQLAAACATLESATESKDNEETITLIVMTIGLLTFQANDAVQELFQMLGKPALKTLTTTNFTPDFTNLVKELLQL